MCAEMAWVFGQKAIVGPKFLLEERPNLKNPNVIPMYGE